MTARDSTDAVVKPERSEGKPEDLELLREVRAAVEQVDAGKGISHEDAKNQLRRLVSRCENGLLDQHADALNDEAEDALSYQVPVWP